MNCPRYFYIWLVPLAFALNSIVSFEYPGDEYGTWAVASFPGVWVPILKSNDDIHGLRYPVAMGGALIIALVGWRMDKTPVNKLLWLGCVLLLPLAIWICIRIKFGPIDESSQTEIPEVIFGLLGVGIWLGSLVAAIIGFVMRHWVRKTSSAEEVR